MSRYYRNWRAVATEYNGDQIIAYHIIRLPGLGLKDGYVSARSFDAFMRREADRISRSVSGSRYSLNDAAHYLLLAKHDRAIERTYTTMGNDSWRRNKPIHRHSSIWDFYKFIGFDHKKNKFSAA